MRRFNRHISLFLLLAFLSPFFVSSAATAYNLHHLLDEKEDIAWVKSCGIDLHESAEHINTVSSHSPNGFKLIGDTASDDEDDSERLIIYNCNNSLFVTSSEILFSILQKGDIFKSNLIHTPSQLFKHSIGEPPRLA